MQQSLFKKISRPFGIKTSTAIILLLIIVCTILSLTPQSVFAGHQCMICKVEHDVSELQFMAKPAYYINEFIYGNEIIDDNLKTLLSFDMNSATYYDIWVSMQGKYDTLKPLGILLAMTYIFLSLLEEANKDSVTMETVMKALIKVFLAALFMTSGMDILKAALDLVAAVYYSLEPPDDFLGSGTTNCNYETLLDFSGLTELLTPIGIILGQFFAYIVTLVGAVVARLVIWARILDVLVRTMFAPIGMADLAQEGMQGSGFKYLKAYAASALTGAALVGCMYAFRALNYVATSICVNGGDAAMASLIMAYTLIGTMFNAKSIADDIVGL